MTPSIALPKATHQGKLTISGFEIECYVLNTPTHDRVLSRQGFMKALGRHNKPTGRKNNLEKEDNDVKEYLNELPSFLDAANIKPFIDDELLELIKPIFFTDLNNKQARGYRVEILKDVCYVFIDALKKGVLQQSQLHVAERCELLVRGFAAVGIRALVDEATGFQEIRPRDDLQRFLDTFLLKEYARWVKRFPDEFFENIFLLKGWNGGRLTSKRPQIIGHYINDIVYDRLAPLILDELRTKNPVDEKGSRKTKHHQWLTSDVGHPKLQEHLTAVMALQRVAGGSWHRFMSMLDAAFPRYRHTISLQFGQNDSLNQNTSPSLDNALKGAMNVPRMSASDNIQSLKIEKPTDSDAL